MGHTYSHIDMAERRKIYRWINIGLAVDVIAEKLGRHRSTIFREIKRNYFKDPEIEYLNGYHAVTAHEKAQERRYSQRKLVRFSSLRDAVVERLRFGWSPEQIVGRLRLEGRTLRISHEAIYQFAHSRDGQEIELWKSLPERRRRRRSRHKRRYYAHRFGPDVNILNRPELVAKRSQFGHWECDLIQFRKKFGKANVTSLVERVSRFTVLLRNNDRQSRPIMENIIKALSPLPLQARRSITFDRGTEFTDWPYLQAGIGSQTWFCDPQSPWQKGTVENTNRRTRAFLPRDRDPLELKHHDLINICNRLNETPRKCLGYRTPAEVFRKKILDQRRTRQ